MDVLSWGTKFPGTVDEAWARAIDQPTRLKIMLEGFPTENACLQVQQMLGRFWYCNPSVISSFFRVLATIIVGYTP